MLIVHYIYSPVGFMRKIQLNMCCAISFLTLTETDIPDFPFAPSLTLAAIMYINELPTGEKRLYSEFH